MKKKKVKFNKNIALKAFRILDDAWGSQKGIFKNLKLPQDRWPSQNELKSLSKKELANWFFYASLPLRGGVVTETPTKLFWDLKKLYPKLFDPESVIKYWSSEKIKKALNEIGIKYKDKEHARAWYQNSQSLSNWGNNVLNIFAEAKNFEEAFSRIDPEQNKEKAACFTGMRRKIFALFTIFLQQKNLIPSFPTPIPVDFHAMRVLWSTEVINLGDWAKPFTPKEKHPKQLANKLAVRVWYGLPDQIMLWSQDFLKKFNLSHSNLNSALWFLSRALCADHPQNSSKENGMKYLETEELANNPALWPKSYRNPCAICPVEEYCQWCIPGAPYFKWGILVRIGKRVPYPYPATKYLPGLEHFHKPHKNRGAN